MTRFPDRDSRPRHEATQDVLLDMIRQFEVVGNFGNYGDYHALRDAGAASLRLEAINVLSSARRELEICGDWGSLSYVEVKLADPWRRPHSTLISWINDLSIELKLMHNGLADHASDITAQQLEQGKRLIMELDECREQLRFER